MLPYLISYLCLGINPIYNQSCIQGLNAASMQIHLKQNLDIYQEKLTKMVETEVDRTTGKEVWVVGITGYQILKKEQLSFNGPIRPVADSLSMNVSRTDSSFTFTWMF